jgi:hypothetical protein
MSALLPRERLLSLRSSKGARESSSILLRVRPKFPKLRQAVGSYLRLKSGASAHQRVVAEHDPCCGSGQESEDYNAVSQQKPVFGRHCPPFWITPLTEMARAMHPRMAISAGLMAPY